MRHAIDWRAAAVAGVAAVFSGVAGAQPARVIHTNVPLAPGNTPPGVTGAAFRNGSVIGASTGPFQRPSISPDGQRWAVLAFMQSDGVAITSANDSLVLSGTLGGASTLIAREGSTIGTPGTLTGDLNGTFDPQTSVRSNGDVGYVTLGNFQPGSVRDRVAIQQNGAVFTILAREATPSGLGFNWGSNMGAFNFTSTAFALRSQTTGAGGKDALVLNGAIAAQNTSGTNSSPTGQLVAPTNRAYSTFAFDKFRVSADGAHWIGWGVLASSPGNGTVLAVDNDVKAQFGAPLPGSGFTTNVATIDGVDMSVNGDWSVRGTSTLSTEAWALVNGALVAKTNDPIGDGTWQWFNSNPSTTFSGVAVNCRGDFVISGGILNLGAAQIAPGLVVNNTRVVLKGGDVVDVDNNGVLDDAWYVAGFQNDSLAVTSDGWVVGVVTLTSDILGGAATNAALFRIRAWCPGDYTKDGSKTIDDIFIYINAWFAGKRDADTDCSGGNTIDDIFIFLNEWFGTSCPN